MTSSVGKCAAVDTQSIILSLYFCRVLFHSTGFVAQKWKYIARDDHLEIRKIPLTMSWFKKKKVMCWVFKCSSTQVFVMLSATNSRGSVWATHVSMSCILHTFASTCLLSTFRKEKRKNVYSSSWALWTPLWAYIYINSEIIQAKGASTSSPMYMSKQTCLLSPFKKKRKLNIDYHVVPSQC